MGYKQVTKCSKCKGKVSQSDPKNGTTKRSDPMRVFQKRICPHCWATYKAEQIEGPVVKGE